MSEEKRGTRSAKQWFWSCSHVSFLLTSVWRGQYLLQGSEVTSTWDGICRYSDPQSPTPPPPYRQHLNLATHTQVSADQKKIKRKAWLKCYWQFNKMLMALPALRPSTTFSFFQPKSHPFKSQQHFKEAEQRKQCSLIILPRQHYRVISALHIFAQ